MGTCIVLKHKCSGKLCLHKKTFQSLGRSNFPCPQCASVCQVRNIPSGDQRNSVFLSLGQGFYIFEENPKSVQDVFGDMYCPGKYCLNREKCESFGGYVITPRSLYDWEGVEPSCLFTEFIFCYRST